MNLPQNNGTKTDLKINKYSKTQIPRLKEFHRDQKNAESEKKIFEAKCF